MQSTDDSRWFVRGIAITTIFIFTLQAQPTARKPLDESIILDGADLGLRVAKVLVPGMLKE